MKKLLSLAVLLLVLILLFFLTDCAKTQTFPDVPSMEKKIAKELNAAQVSVFDMQDIGGYRIVGYAADTDCSFAVFKQNEKGKYTFDFVKKAEKLIKRAENIGVGYHDTYWIAVSGNPALRTIRFEIDSRSGVKYETVTLDVVENPSIRIIEMPTENFEGEYNFYDGEGNLIQ